MSLRNSVTVLVVAASILIGCLAAEDHDGVLATSPPGDMKCTCSPCGNPCGVIPPPPPPPPPPKGPATSYCPPPPPPPFLIVGPPGNLYPSDPEYYISRARRSLDPFLPVLVVSVLLALWV